LTERKRSKDRPDPPATVILALGNLIRSDDAAGIHALALLEQDPRVPPHVRFVEGGTKGLELVSFLAGAVYLLVLDAVDAGAAPGTVFRMATQDLGALPGSGNVHGLALGDILNALRLMAQDPAETVLLGIQPSTTQLGTALSAPVEKALPALARAAIAELHRWDVFHSVSGHKAREPLFEVA